jgi:hypothetical protein
MRACTKCVVEGQPKVIPPLSQSRQGDMACRCLYIRKHVTGGPIAETGAAARGTEVHQILATYINHLVRTRRSTDLELLDRLMSGASGEAQAALERFRENHAFAPERVLATELYIALDDDFNPIEDATPDENGPENEGVQAAAYEGGLLPENWSS